MDTHPVGQQERRVAGTPSHEVVLNLRGTLFPTTLETLMSAKGSYFEVMFGGRWSSHTQDDGSISIDRDPRVFQHVLDFMRGQPPPMDVLKCEEDREALKDDARFYLLDNLLEALEHPIELKWDYGSGYFRSDDAKTTATRSFGGAYNATVLGVQGTSRGTHWWQVRISKTRGGNIMIGVAPESIKEINHSVVKDVFLKSGWYFSCLDRTLYSGPPTPRSNEPYGPAAAAATPLREGSVVGVKLDATRGEISFYVDGVDYGVAFSDVPTTEPFYPCAILCHADTIVIEPFGRVVQQGDKNKE